MLRPTAFLLATLAFPACVIGRPARPSLVESAAGPNAPPVTGSPVVAVSTPGDSEAPPQKARPGALWVHGYWHWDGVQYVWQRGRWEEPAAP